MVEKVLKPALFKRKLTVLSFLTTTVKVHEDKTSKNKAEQTSSELSNENASV